MPAPPISKEAFFGLGGLIRSDVEGGYQPEKFSLNNLNPPCGGSGIPSLGAVDETKLLLNSLSDRIQALERLIDRIFDGHILINGQWRKIKLNGGI